MLKPAQRWDAPRGTTLCENNESGEFVMFDEHRIIENNFIVKLQFAESVIFDQDKAIKEMVEAYGEMEKGIEDPILCHYNGLRLHNAMEDLRALVIPGYKLNYEPNLEPEPDGSPEENLNPGLK